MACKKRDWDTLKIEFFISDFDSVTDFFKSKKWVKNQQENSKLSWQITKKTKWWGKERLERRRHIIDKALKEAEEKKAKELEIDVEDLLLIKKDVIEAIKRKLELHIKWKRTDTPLKDIMSIVKDELWENDNKKETFIPYNIFNISNAGDNKDSNS
jgi:hypothetical protein